jgi:hypothetical protein
VHYYVPYEEEQEETLQDLDSPQSRSQVSDLFPPLVILMLIIRELASRSP